MASRRARVIIPAQAMGIAAVAVALTFAPPLRAHEIGTTRVSVVELTRDRYVLEISTDAAALLEKLESVSRTESASGAGADAATLQRRLERLEGVFRERATIAFDRGAVHPDVSWTIVPSNVAGGTTVVTIRLSGVTPPGAEWLTWKYSWTFASYAFVPPNDEATQWLEGGQTSARLVLGAAPVHDSRLTLIGRYAALGFTHILPKGIDHVLFVLGLFLLSRRARPLLLQISAFTIAHSMTLALSIFGVVRLSSSLVEPLIALSIAYVAIENVFMSRLTSWRYALVFAFGLLHGLGFAGALSEVGLPRAEFLTALVGFNVGVELGQLSVVAGAFLLVGYWFRDRPWYRQRVVVPASMWIACLGIYWTLQRLPLGLQ